MKRMTSIQIDGPLLRKVRRTRRESAQQLAAQIGCSRNHLLTIETGAANPSIKLLDRLAGVVGVNVTAALIKRREDRDVFLGDFMEPSGPSQALGSDK